MHCPGCGEQTACRHLPELPLNCMGRGQECPWGFLPQDQLVAVQPDVVSWIGLSVIKLEEFQGTCKFANKENSKADLQDPLHLGPKKSSSGMQHETSMSTPASWVHQPMLPVHVAKATRLTSPVLRPCWRPVLSSLPSPAPGTAACWLSAQHSQGNPPGHGERFKPQDEKGPCMSLTWAGPSHA